MNSSSWMVAVGAALSCQMVLADVPPIFDRIPADAAVVVVMPQLAEMKEAVDTISGFAGEEAMGDMAAMADMFGSIQALDMTKSAAVFFPAVAGGFDMAEPPMVALLPVTDYGAFVGQFGGTAGSGIDEFQIEGQPAYARSLGGGYAAMSPMLEALESYEAGNGARKAHESRMGELAADAAGNADVFIAADLSVFASQIEEGIQGFAQNMAMFGAVGGQDMSGQVDTVKKLGKRMVEDGQIGFMAVDVSGDGVQAGFGMQFKDGSDTAGYLTDAGSAGRLTSQLPAKDLLFAFGADMSTPGSRQINGAITQMLFSNMPGMDLLLNDITGMGFVMGESPGGLMGGTLFGSTTAYIESSDPAAHMAGMKAGILGLNGMTVDGTTYKTAYEDDASVADGTDLNAWSIQLQLDPAMGQQAMMAMGMLFGPAGGPGGYVAETEDGMIVTLSKSSDLAGQAVKAANSANGLTASDAVRNVASHLPEGRSVELYIGVGNILEMFMFFMTMQMGPMDIEVPEDLPPVGLGVATEGGGIEIRGFAPAGVITLMQEIGAAVEAAEGAMPGPPEGNSGPRF